MNRFDSTDDARVANSPMRHQYRTLSEAEKEQVAAIKQSGEHFLSLLVDQSGTAGREFALARTKIEEAVMWAVKGITK